MQSKNEITDSPDGVLEEIAAILAQGYLRQVKDRRRSTIPEDGPPDEESEAVYQD